MTKNLIYAVVLSTLVIIFYNFFIFPKYLSTKKPQELKEKEIDKTLSKEKINILAQPVSELVAEKTRQRETIEPTGEGKDIIVDTKLYKAIVSAYSGEILKWELKKYFVTNYKSTTANMFEKKENVRLIDHAVSKHLPLKVIIPYFKEISYSFNTERLDLSNDTAESNLVITANLANVLKVEKHYTFNNKSYAIDYKITFTNLTTYPIKIEDKENNCGIMLGLGAGLGNANIHHKGRLEEITAVVQNKAISFIRLTPKTSQKLYSGDISWAGLQTLYFLKALIPIDPPQSVFTKLTEDNLPSVWVNMPSLELAPNEVRTYSFVFYCGPKSEEALAFVKLNKPEILFSGSILSPLNFIILKTLKLCYRAIPNYGVAIIMIAMLFKILTFPLTHISFKSIKKMQALAPQINALREKYKNNPQQLNQQMLLLWRQHKVNPMSGCLPMIIQMPIFFALYSTLTHAIELRAAPFILWIKDLSQPDTVAYIFGLPLNILPILMGVSMFIQQKMSATPGDPKSAQMSTLMTMLFILIFWGLSSGLVLYWLVTNIFSIFHQYFINKQKFSVGT